MKLRMWGNLLKESSFFVSIPVWFWFSELGKFYGKITVLSRKYSRISSIRHFFKQFLVREVILLAWVGFAPWTLNKYKVFRINSYLLLFVIKIVISSTWSKPVNDDLCSFPRDGTHWWAIMSTETIFFWKYLGSTWFQFLLF